MDPLGVLPFAWWGRRCLTDVNGEPVTLEATSLLVEQWRIPGA